MDHTLPPGWRRLEDEAGLVYYITRKPEVKISRRSHLESYHRKQRYLEMALDDLDFGTKKRSKKYSMMEVDSKKIESKKPKLEESVDGEESEESSSGRCSLVLHGGGEGYQNLSELETRTSTWQFRDAVEKEKDNLEELETADTVIDVGGKLEEKRGKYKKKYDEN